MRRINYTGQLLDGRYRVEKLLGAGGMGAVYLAHHAVLEKPVAVKFLHAEYADNEALVRRFYREGKVAVSVQHKNIIDVLDVGVSEESEPYLVMEYLEGESLSVTLSRTGPLRLPAACAVLDPVLSALSAAHEKGIVHRDLKPENIFLAIDTDGSVVVKLIDFGISKLMSAKRTMLTQTGALIGTPSSMAPEQIVAPKSVDHRVDIYAVGVIMYEMLTGRPPFSDEHYEGLIYKVVAADPRPPKEVYKDFPDEVAPIVMQCLSKDPNERPQTAEALRGLLEPLSGYQQRDRQLGNFTSGITAKTVAGGALGPDLRENGTNLAKKILAELTPNTTPTSWSKEGTRNPKKNRAGWMIGGAASIAIVCVVGLLTVWKNKPEPSGREAVEQAGADGSRGEAAPLASSVSIAESATPPDSTAKPLSETVALEIVGAPEGATYTFKGKLYETSPLVVKRSDDVGTLKVSMPGYKEWHYNIAPNKDFAIVVTLEPLPTPPVESPPSSSSSLSTTRVSKKTGDARKQTQAQKVEQSATTGKPTDTEPPLPKGFKANW